MIDPGERGRSVLIVAGEGSGDRIASMAARELASRGVRCWGVAGEACRRAGVEVLADASSTGAMGLSDALLRAPAVALALGKITRRAVNDRPDAALLVNFTELNTYVGRALRRLGVRVVWCVAPQAWAWRGGRFRTLGRSLDTLAVILPFEEELWRRAGVDARYVGHPSLEAIEAITADQGTSSRAEIRRLLRLPAADDAATIAVLPGSRRGEVARLARPLCEAAALLIREGSAAAARVLVAPWLDAGSSSLVTREAARVGLALAEPTAEGGASPWLSAFDVSLCASGTASLEAALLGALPVVTYRLDALSFAVARRLVKTPHIALPNILLGRRVFPELLQSEVTPARIAASARALLKQRAEEPSFAAGLAAELAGVLRPRDEPRARDAREAREAELPSPSPSRSFGARVADLLFAGRVRPEGEEGDKDTQTRERNRHSLPRGYLETSAPTRSAETSGRGRVTPASIDAQQSSSAGGSDNR